jgi:hypothetical protein
VDSFTSLAIVVLRQIGSRGLGGEEPGTAALRSFEFILIASLTIGAAYSEHWHQRLALSLPYTQRRDWFRSADVADFNRNHRRDEN